MTTYTHLCNFPGCSISIGKNAWACSAHWQQLDPVLRIELWNNYPSPIEYARSSTRIKEILALALRAKLDSGPNQEHAK